MIRRVTSSRNYNNMFSERRVFMKNVLIKNYVTVILAIYLGYNFMLANLKIGGILYEVFIILIIILNGIILIKFRKEIEYKNLGIIVYYLTWLFSKEIFQCCFNFSNIIILCILAFRESLYSKVIIGIISTLAYNLFQVLCFVFLLAFSDNYYKERGLDDIYWETYYRCENNYEVYSHSAGAMDGFHYSIGKYYEILDIDDIIYIAVRERNENSKEEYQEYLDTHNCSLVRDKNGSK